MNAVTRENHFVPQALLRRWSNDKAFLNAYELLVNHEEVPIWSRKSIRSAACQSDLYTEFDGERDSDAFEREVGRDYETPALAVIDDLVENRRVSAEGWRHLIDFFALQALRTRRAFITFAERAERHINEALTHSVKEAEAMLSRWGRLLPADTHERVSSARSRPAAPYFKDTLRVRLEPLEDGRAVARAIVKSPRSLWTAGNRHILELGAAEVLRHHRWSVAEAHGDLEWPMADHPVVTLQFNSTTDYELTGGWGKQNTDLLLPISPKKLLFVEVGKKMANRFTLDADQTRFLQKVMVENAHRVVFTRNKEQWPIEVRPRVVDAKQYDDERANWRRWNEFHKRQEETFHALAGSDHHHQIRSSDAFATTE